MAAGATVHRRAQPLQLVRGPILPLGERTLLMGVVNVTPDSFYRGSRTPDPRVAVERALQLVEDGADLVDVGGESTRPGSLGVTAAEELERVLPVIEGVRRATPVPIAVDTRKAAVARAALAAGADLVNDTSALTADPEMAATVAAAGAVAVLMHMRGTPRTMQQEARYGDVLAEVRAELAARLEAAERAGIDPARLWIDPGLGFAKTARHSLEILARLEELHVLGRPLLVGASRKSFLGRILGEELPEERLEGSLAAAVAAVLKGAHVLRVHDVAATRRAVRVADALLDPGRLAE